MKHVSAYHLAKDANYLPAEDFVYDEQHRDKAENAEKVVYFTRVFEHEGVFYDLRRERVKGTERVTRAIGARAAVAHDHPRADYSVSGLTIPGSTSFIGSGLYLLHLFDTPLDQWGYRSVGMHLHHLVVHASVFVDPGDTDGVEVTIENLEAAALAWSPGHPATTPPEKKTYALVPQTGLEERSPLVLVRHFFSHRRKESPGPFRIQLHRQVVANFDPSKRTMNLEREDVKASGEVFGLVSRICGSAREARVVRRARDTGRFSRARRFGSHRLFVS